MRVGLVALAAALIVGALTLPGLACAKKPPAPVEVAATPDAAESGLVQALIATFQRQSSVKISLRIVPEEEALRLATDRAVQVVFTDDPAASRKYEGVARLSGPFAFHDFAILGPRRDPAHVHLALTAADALRRIAKHKARFCSAVEVPRVRRREQRLWATAGIDPTASRRYSECHGDGLAALRAADRMNAYTLSDAQAVAAAGTNLDVKGLLEGTPDLHDDYSVVLVDHAPRIRRDRDAEWFVQWLMSYQGRDAVQNFRVDGVQAFSVSDAAGK